MRMRPLSVLCFVLLFAPILSAEVPLDEVRVEDRLMLVLQEGTSEAQARELAKSYDAELLRVYSALGAVVVRSAPGKAQALSVRMQSDPRVLQSGSDFYTKWIEAVSMPVQAPLPAVEETLKSLPKLSPELGKGPEEVQWGVQRVGAPNAWPSNKGTGVKIGIIDTGIDPGHPEFSGRVKGGYNAIDKDKPWSDDHFHGTHVAGIAAAALDGQGVVGVAPEAELYAVKALSKDGGGSLFSIIGAMDWCVANGIKVANMSLGSPNGIFLFRWAVERMVKGGVTLVAAAGNDGGAVNYPAAYEGAVAVSALDDKDGIASFSSRGAEVDFIAPGVKILSTVPGGGYAAYSGTSMATPHVTGLAALAVAGGAQGPDAVRGALSRAAVKVDALKPEEQGGGVVDAGRL